MKQIGKKLAIRFSVIYTVTTVIYSFCMLMDGARVQAGQYLMLFGMFVVLWLITCFRVLLDQFQWGLQQHYLLKRVLFAPLYLGVTLVTLLHFGYPFENSQEDVLFITVIFLIGFVISLALMLPSAKKQEKDFEQMLQAYQSQILEDKR